MPQYTSARILKDTKEKIKEYKKRFKDKSPSEDAVINIWRSQSELYEQLTKKE